MEFKDFSELEKNMSEEALKASDEKFNELMLGYTLSQIRETRGITQLVDSWCPTKALL